MKMIKVQKTIQQMPLQSGINFCLQALEKPKDVSRNKFAKQIRKDLLTGKKSIRIREITLAGT